MYDQHLAFLDWVRAYELGAANVRSLAQHRAWLSDFKNPMVVINEPMSVEAILKRDRRIFGSALIAVFECVIMTPP
ncbi:MAG: hypothetical protein MZU97_03845 [Bacillus subtilis]|nr:hypothetical protein [Bacillus subtilis]